MTSLLPLHPYKFIEWQIHIAVVTLWRLITIQIKDVIINNSFLDIQNQRTYVSHIIKDVQNDLIVQF